MLNFQKQKIFLSNIQHDLKQFDTLDEFVKSITKEQKNVKALNSKIKKKEIEVKLYEDEILRQNQILAKNINKAQSFTHKITKVFSSKPTLAENRIVETENKIFKAKKNAEFSKYKMNEIIKNKEIIQTEINDQRNKVSFLIDKFKQQNSEVSNIKKILNSLSINNYTQIKEQLFSTLDELKKQIEVDEHLFVEYNNNSFLNIETDLNNYLILRNRLALSSTEERLKSVNVIACTLDGYIGRYTETNLNVEHIFLDEAGYANIIKALTLFNHSTPISFLGDHMQLPPVCEINDGAIERDEKHNNIFLWAQSAIFLDTLFLFDKAICRNQYLKNVEFSPNQMVKTSLNATYRFGNNLATILATYVYSNDFNSSNPKRETKIFYIDAKKTESLMSRISNNEVQEIKKLVNKLKQKSKDNFVILTPYKKQVKLLNRELPQERNDLKILTVHGSQGREWETVILSVVDTSDKWFVDTTIAISKGLNLVNTAVSRAQQNLIIVCDKHYWEGQNGQLITELIKCGQEIKN
jgi:hypothetical protein